MYYFIFIMNYYLSLKEEIHDYQRTVMKQSKLKNRTVLITIDGWTTWV